jgi:hypothetical protein
VAVSCVEFTYVVVVAFVNVPLVPNATTAPESKLDPLIVIVVPALPL